MLSITVYVGRVVERGCVCVGGGRRQKFYCALAIFLISGKRFRLGRTFHLPKRCSYHPQLGKWIFCGKVIAPTRQKRNLWRAAEREKKKAPFLLHPPYQICSRWNLDVRIDANGGGKKSTLGTVNLWLRKRKQFSNVSLLNQKFFFYEIEGQSKRLMLISWQNREFL